MITRSYQNFRETDDLENQPSNVKISKWLPQADLLSHPNIKLFIMQGGQQSLEEAIDRTIPLVVKEIYLNFKDRFK